MKSVFLFILVGFLAIKTNAQTTPIKKTEEVKIATSAQCEMCKERIEKALYKVKGVISANLDLQTKAVTVIYRTHKTNVDALRQAINLAGYDADDSPADIQAYEKLPDCCKKDGAIHH
jgi:copper chaperone CopZ